MVASIDSLATASVCKIVLSEKQPYSSLSLRPPSYSSPEGSAPLCSHGAVWKPGLLG